MRVEYTRNTPMPSPHECLADVLARVHIEARIGPKGPYLPAETAERLLERVRGRVVGERLPLPTAGAGTAGKPSDTEARSV